MRIRLASPGPNQCCLNTTVVNIRHLVSYVPNMPIESLVYCRCRTCATKIYAIFGPELCDLD